MNDIAIRRLDASSLSVSPGTYSFRCADSVRTFWSGTPSLIPEDIASEGPQLLASNGIHSILARSRALIPPLIQSAPAYRRPPIASLEECSRLLCIHVVDDLSRVYEFLRVQNIPLDTRGPVCRQTLVSRQQFGTELQDNPPSVAMLKHQKQHQE